MATKPASQPNIAPTAADCLLQGCQAQRYERAALELAACLEAMEQRAKAIYLQWVSLAIAADLERFWTQIGIAALYTAYAVSA